VWAVCKFSTHLSIIYFGLYFYLDFVKRLQVTVFGLAMWRNFSTKAQ
jgi:hypothetical protein